ncbi:hypothetical protein Tco_1306362 [Tanacetum coccineum]
MTNAVLAPPTDPPNTRDGSGVWEIHKHGLLGKRARKDTPLHKGRGKQVTGVPSQEGAEGNVAEKKKVERVLRSYSKGKILKYNPGHKVVPGSGSSKGKDVEIMIMFKCYS